MSLYPRAEQSGEYSLSVIYSDIVQEGIPSHVAYVPGCGDVLFHHASAVNVTTLSVGDGPDRIVLGLAQPACKCGCQSRGRGLILTPDAESAREIAKRLIHHADLMEAEAAHQAAATLRKAGGK